MTDFKIDVSKTFENLPRAPIVEAVIDMRARATIRWDEKLAETELKPQLPDYPHLAIQNTLVFGVTLTPGLAQTKQEDYWKGLQFKSQEGQNIATFTRDGFTFSRLQPYKDWAQLQNEALRLWKIHASLAKPIQIERIGVRFINRIDLPVQPVVKLKDYIDPPPSKPNGLQLPFAGFLHIDTFSVPGYPYTMNLTRTLQPADSVRKVPALILDIDVFLLQTPDLADIKGMEERLAEMRWLKNQAFFGSITETAKDMFK